MPDGYPTAARAPGDATAGARASVVIDLGRIRSAAETIRAATGREIWAVVKADAYGLGAAAVAAALAEVVDGFCVFSLAEAARARLAARTRRPVLALGPPRSLDPDRYRRHGVRPAVSTRSEARALRRAAPVLSVDTGMGRFACPPEEVEAVLAAGAIEEAFTHALELAQVELLTAAVNGRVERRHAASTRLLGEPAAWLDAVRPGLALFRDAVTVRAPLVEVRRCRGRTGYTGFTCDHYGVILLGYAHGLRPGPCRVDGRRRRILEVGMQSACVEVGSTTRAGHWVELLSPELPPEEVAAAWGATPHEVLARLARSGPRRYVGG